jgi:general stress protein 26
MKAPYKGLKYRFYTPIYKEDQIKTLQIWYILSEMKHNKSSLEKIDAWNFLQDHPIGTLASINTDGSPDLSAVYFFTKSDFSCYFVTKVETRKYQNFLKNPKATLLSFFEEERISVEVQGNVETVHDVVKVAQIIEQFQNLVASRSAEYWIPPIAQISAGEYVVCMLVPTLVHFNDFGKDPVGTAPQQLTFYPVH